MMRYALVQDDRVVKCHCISVRDTIDDLLSIPVEGKVKIIPIPDNLPQNGEAISNYCNTHKGAIV